MSQDSSISRPMLTVKDRAKPAVRGNSVRITYDRKTNTGPILHTPKPNDPYPFLRVSVVVNYKLNYADCASHETVVMILE